RSQTALDILPAFAQTKSSSAIGAGTKLRLRTSSPVRAASVTEATLGGGSLAMRDFSVRSIAQNAPALANKSLRVALWRRCCKAQRAQCLVVRQRVGRSDRSECARKVAACRERRRQHATHDLVGRKRLLAQRPSQQTRG